MNHIDARINTANTQRKFGSTNFYVPATVTNLAGKEVPALFTQDQINEAAARAVANPEDAPQVRTQWVRLRDWLREIFD